MVPRISATSGLLSNSMPPTTVCTSATPARAVVERITREKPSEKHVISKDNRHEIVSKYHRIASPPHKTFPDKGNLTEAVLKSEYLQDSAKSNPVLDDAKATPVTCTEGVSVNSASFSVKTEPRHVETPKTGAGSKPSLAFDSTMSVSGE